VLYRLNLFLLVFMLFNVIVCCVERSLSLNYVDCDGGEKQAESADCIHPRELIAYDSSVHSEDGRKEPVFVLLCAMNSTNISF